MVPSMSNSMPAKWHVSGLAEKEALPSTGIFDVSESKKKKWVSPAVEHVDVIFGLFIKVRENVP